ncbi:MAG: hypothetical protein AB7P17_09825 [Nitrospirales bacterium]|nr:hypothetical protein [Nitrospirales bacterium]
MSQIASLTTANAIAQLTLPLIQASVLPQKNGQPQTPTTPSLNVTDTVSISAKAAALQKQKI